MFFDYIRTYFICKHEYTHWLHQNKQDSVLSVVHILSNTLDVHKA